jgi:hypothetical protein
MHVSNLEVAKVLTRVRKKNKNPQMEVSNSRNSPKNTRTEIPAGGILVFYTNYEYQYVYVRHPNHHPPPPLKLNIPYIVKST